MTMLAANTAAMPLWRKEDGHTHGAMSSKQRAQIYFERGEQELAMTCLLSESCEMGERAV